jgi:hypothetical protein
MGLTQLTEEVWGMMDIPEDANGFEVYENNVIGGLCIMYLRGNPDYACEYTGNLPEGSWEIIGTSDEHPEYEKEIANSGLRGRVLILRKK